MNVKLEYKHNTSLINCLPRISFGLSFDDSTFSQHDKDFSDQGFFPMKSKNESSLLLYYCCCLFIFLLVSIYDDDDDDDDDDDK